MATTKQRIAAHLRVLRDMWYLLYIIRVNVTVHRFR
jgi:hypothetical protein